MKEYFVSKRMANTQAGEMFNNIFLKKTLVINSSFNTMYMLVYGHEMDSNSAFILIGRFHSLCFTGR